MSDNLVFKSASEMARMIRTREVSAKEVLQAHLTHIEKHNSKINAFAALDAEKALEKAKAADSALAKNEIWGALHGVPVTVKDTWETAGLRTACGFKPLKNYVPPRDAPVVEKLKAAGAIILGKSNVPQLSFDIQTDNPISGRTNNPHDVSKTCGGSTGGGAAAVAAGFSPLELGGDFGGSIRIPSHFCGVFGFKPSAGRVERAGHILPLPGGAGRLPTFLTAGILARSAEDLRLGFSVIENENGKSEQTALADFLPGVRFALLNEFADFPVSSETSAALENLAGKLAENNCRVELTKLESFDFKQSWETWGEIALADMTAGLPFVLKNFLRMNLWLNRKESPLNRGMSRGVGLNQKDYEAANERRAELTKNLDALFENFDALILPVAAVTAFPHCKPGAKIAVDGEPTAYSMAATAFTCPFSVTGNPALALPLTKSKDNLPIGAQIVGRRGEDYFLLNVAEKMSQIIGNNSEPLELPN